MEKKEFEFKKITSLFLERFEVIWVESLKNMNCAQKQLIIGSRLRPQITLWGYLSNKNSYQDLDFTTVAEIAVSIEMIHKASLLIDDWIDGDEARHGEKTFHISYSPQYAVVTAIYIVSESMRRLKRVLPIGIIPPSCHYQCIDLIAETVHSMALGLLRELELNECDILDVSIVNDIARLETAEILGNGMLLGYYVSGGENKSIAATFKIIGDQCGYLFQTMNDLEAYSNKKGNMQHKGSVNYDFDEHRKNMAVARLYQLASQKDKEQIKHGLVDDIASLFAKYKVKDTMLRDMELVYKQILRCIFSLSAYGIANEWICHFSEFMGMLKSVAEKRLGHT